MAAVLRSQRRLVRPPELAPWLVRVARRQFGSGASALQRRLLGRRSSWRRASEALGFLLVSVAIGTGGPTPRSRALGEAPGLRAREISPPGLFSRRLARGTRLCRRR